MLHWVRDTILTSNLASSPNWIIIWFIVNVARIYFLPVCNHIYKACEVHHGAGDQHWHVNVRQRDKRACIACFSLAWESRMHNELPASRKLHSHYIFFLHLFQFRKQYTFEFVELMMMMSMSSLHNSLINASYLAHTPYWERTSMTFIPVIYVPKYTCFSLFTFGQRQFH